MTADNRVILKRLAHICYSHSDIDKARAFLEDFGMTLAGQEGNRFYFRGYGDLPYVYVAEKADGKGAFKGTAWEAETREDLEKASRLPRASEIMELTGPGGGYMVTIPDAYNIPFHVVWGQKLREPEYPTDATKPTNLGLVDHDSKVRPPGVYQRFSDDGRAPIHKLGHYVLNVPHYPTAAEFYTGNFNLKPIDILTEGPGGPIVGAFLRLDRGKERVDHHNLFLQTGYPASDTPSIHHSAYELFDVDHEFRAHEFLLSKGWELAWGVGRHILGSQIFDYWHHSDDFNVEHYADGDLVNEDTPVNTHAIKLGPPKEEYYMAWGPKFQEGWLKAADVSLESGLTVPAVKA